jgi:hypothetical protein
MTPSMISRLSRGALKSIGGACRPYSASAAAIRACFSLSLVVAFFDPFSQALACVYCGDKSGRRSRSGVRIRMGHLMPEPSVAQPVPGKMHGIADELPNEPRGRASRSIVAMIR